MWEDMTMGEILVLIVGVFLIIYLFISVIRPERF
jgi:K+-transporting ATPase KdpF subunit